MCKAKEILSELEILKYKRRLEAEIDLCLECDLPTLHLENELIALTALSSTVTSFVPNFPISLDVH